MQQHLVAEDSLGATKLPTDILDITIEALSDLVDIESIAIVEKHGLPLSSRETDDDVILRHNDLAHGWTARCEPRSMNVFLVVVGGAMGAASRYLTGTTRLAQEQPGLAEALFGHEMQ
jgi:hypothetical protein